MLARDVMSTDVVTVGAHATLLEAVTLLINARVSGLPVVDDNGVLAGILSEIDVIRHVAGNDAAALSEFQSQFDDRGFAVTYSQALAETVGSVMTTSVLTAPDDADLAAVAELMLNHRVKRIPIVRRGAVVGIVSRVDLLKALLSRSEEDVPTKVEAQPSHLTLVSDDSLRRSVATAVRQAGIAVSGGFDVVTRNGVVHLWGEVPDDAAHQACRVAAAKVPGVRDVFSHMQVVPRHRRPGPRRLS